jgi:hypothetical protein
MSIFKNNITFIGANGLPPRKFLHGRSMIWIGLMLGGIFLSRILPAQFWEDWYYRGVFPLFRVTYDYTFGWSPIPVVYIIVLIMLFRTVRWSRHMQKGVWFQLSRAIGGISAMIVLFYVLWGYNYGQQSFHKRLGLETLEITQPEMMAEFDRATQALHLEASVLPAKLTEEKALKRHITSDDHLRPDLEKTLNLLNLPHRGRVRVRQLWPNGFLMRWSTAGIYIPQTGEGHIDRGLLAVQKPFTIAHEMAHGYGVTDEGACNFIAWLTCSRSADPWVRFGGALSYWRYAASSMPDTVVMEALASLPPVVRRANDLVRKNNAKYPDLLPKLRNGIYASYLKSHGVESGLKSYSEVVVMVHHYLQTKSVHPQLE